MKENNKNIDLQKWLDGQLTDEEIKALGKEYDLELLRKKLELTDNYTLPAYDVEKSYDELLKKRRQPTGEIKRLIPMWLKIAVAILLLIIPTWFFYQSTQMTTISTGFAEQKMIVLPDKSEVILNAGTEIAYNEKKWEQERVIELSGEAYFKVSKGSLFTVKMHNGSVQVLGTQFNVYSRKNVLSVFCYEGKVRVKTRYTEDILTQGRGTEVRNGKKKLFEETTESPEWTGGQMKFRNAPLKEVFEEMERRYEMKIDFGSIDVKREFTGMLPDDDLELAMKLLAGSMGLEYEISENGGVVTITEKN